MNRLICIAGGSGSGKSFLASKIAEKMSTKEVLILPEDNYYRDLAHLPFEERAITNFDHPDSKDFDLLYNHLHLLKSGFSIDMPRYDFVNHVRIENKIRINPKPIIIAEGILLFQNEDILKIADLSIYVDTSDDVRLRRRIKRDMNERGRSYESVTNQYETTVAPMYAKFVLPTKDSVDLILNGESFSTEIIDQILKRIGR